MTSLTERVVLVIHARMGSVRFPGKMLANLGGYPVLEWVLRRSMRATGVDHVVLATSTLRQDDPISSLGQRLGRTIFRGSHENVLERVIRAAQHQRATMVVRVCADNPFVDPILIGELVESFKVTNLDYMFNHRPGLGLEIADGFGAEIFRMSALESVSERFTEPRYREHLTSPFWEHQDVFRVAALDTHPELKSLERRFDVDTREDLAFLENLIRIGGIIFDTPAVEILEASRHV